MTTRGYTVAGRAFGAAILVVTFAAVAAYISSGSLQVSPQLPVWADLVAAVGLSGAVVATAQSSFSANARSRFRVPHWLVPLAYVVPTVFIALFGTATSVHRFSRYVGIDFRGDRFFDLQNLTAALQCADQHDVVRDNPCDPFQRRFNQPPIWLTVLKPFGLTTADAAWLGFVVLACGALALWIVARATSSLGRVVLLLLAVSPSLQFLAWTGNLEGFDLLLVVLLALVLVRAAQRWRDRAHGEEAGWLAGAAALAIVGGVLKLLPTFSLFAFPIRGRRQTLTAALVSLVVLMGYVVAFGSRIADAVGSTQQSFDDSFGTRVEWAYLTGDPRAVVTGSIGILVPIAVMLILALLAYRAFAVPGEDTHFGDDGTDEPNTFLVAVVPILLVSWVLVSSFDYRWAFAALLIPWAARSLHGVDRVLLVTVPVATLPWVPLASELAVFISIAVAVAALARCLARRYGIGAGLTS